MTSALRAWRKRKGWTLADVCGLTGVAVSYLSLIERGRREPTPEVKVRIARGVGAKVAEVFPAAAGTTGRLDEALPPEAQALLSTRGGADGA